MLKCKIIAVDFDGTLCENKWPEIGKPNREIIEYLKKERRNGAKLVLWTCRVESALQDAIRWCFTQGLVFNAFNTNLPEVIEEFGSDARKIFAHEYIDDRMCKNFKLPYVTNNGSVTGESKDLEAVAK